MTTTVERLPLPRPEPPGPPAAGWVYQGCATNNGGVLGGCLLNFRAADLAGAGVLFNDARRLGAAPVEATLNAARHEFLDADPRAARWKAAKQRLDAHLAELAECKAAARRAGRDAEARLRAEEDPAAAEAARGRAEAHARLLESRSAVLRSAEADARRDAEAGLRLALEEERRGLLVGAEAERRRAEAAMAAAAGKALLELVTATGAAQAAGALPPALVELS